MDGIIRWPLPPVELDRDELLDRMTAAHRRLLAATGDDWPAANLAWIAAREALEDCDFAERDEIGAFHEGIARRLGWSDEP